MHTKHILAAIGLATATLLPSMASAQPYEGHAGYYRTGGYDHGHGRDWRERQRWEQHRRWEEARRRHHWQHERREHRHGDRNWR